MANGELGAARTEAAAAMRRLREAAGQVLTTLSEAQPVAPQHLLVLGAIAEGARTPGEVATAIDRHASSVSRVIDHLVDSDLVERRTDPDDRRQVLVALTGSGERVIHRFHQIDLTLSQRMLDGFDESDARRLAGYLDRIAANATDLAARLETSPDLLDELG